MQRAMPCGERAYIASPPTTLVSSMLIFAQSIKSENIHKFYLCSTTLQTNHSLTNYRRKYYDMYLSSPQYFWILTRLNLTFPL